MAQRYTGDGHGTSFLHRPALAGRPAEGGGASVRTDTASSSLVLLAFIISLAVIPGSFSVAGVNLTFYKLILLALFVPLSLRWITGQEGPVTAADILILLYVVWVGVSVFAVHGSTRLFYIMSNFATTFGSYLVGRMMVRNAMDFRMFCRYFLIGLVLLFPFALVEFLTNKNLLTMIFGKVFTISGNETAAGGRRLGFIRARGAFEHPILLGLFCGIGLGSVVYTFRESFLRQWAAGLFVCCAVFTSISTGPFIAVAVQLLLIVWDRALRFIKSRWLVLGFLGLMGAMFLTFGSQLDIKELVVNQLALDSVSAAGRFDIIKYGLLEVGRHPMFGIGFNDWARPFWKNASFDNFWLGMAMRFGIPTLVFLVLAVGWSCLRIISQTGLTDTERSYRTGYLISLAGLVVVLGTVNIWGATEVFIMTFVGAGSWFYTSSEIRERAETERLRRMRGPAGRTGPAVPPSGPVPATPSSGYRPLRAGMSATRPQSGPASPATSRLPGTRTGARFSE